MPLVFEKVESDNYHLALWKVTESIEDLKRDIGQDISRLEVYEKAKFEKRRVEWIGRNYLFDYLEINDLSYLSNGKPVLEDGFISISHCNDVVVVIKSIFPVGIDLQNPQPIIKRIGKKFCNQKELDWISKMNDDLEGFTIVWSAKEAVFKIYGTEIPFAEGMFIEYSEANNSAVCHLKTKDHEAKIPIVIDRFEGYFVVWNGEG